MESKYNKMVFSSMSFFIFPSEFSIFGDVFKPESKFCAAASV